MVERREPASARKAFLLRINPGVMRSVQALAAAELRSVNAQIEILVREALEARGRRTP